MKLKLKREMELKSKSKKSVFRIYTRQCLGRVCNLKWSEHTKEERTAWVGLKCWMIEDILKAEFPSAK